MATAAPVDPELYRCSPRLAREFIVEIIQSGRVPMLVSSPGVGKSSLFRAIAKDFRLKLIDHRASTSDPTDYSGLPDLAGDRACFKPFNLFPIEQDTVPDGYDGWMLFFDEFNSAPEQVQAACYKVMLDRMIGQHKLHPRCIVVAAGNLLTDKAIVNNLGTAMQSRLVWIEMEANAEEWLHDVAVPQGFDSRIQAYVGYRNTVMEFDPNHEDKTFMCPRTLEFLSDLIKGKDVEVRKTPLYAGTISVPRAIDFVSFCDAYQHIPNIGVILADPATAPVPTDAPTKWAVIGHLLEKVDDKNFDKLAIYVNRFDSSHRVLFYRAVQVRLPGLRSTPSFAAAMRELSKWLHDED